MTEDAGPTDQDLLALSRRLRDDLFIDFLPFMDDHVIDHEHGGFCCTTTPSGTRVAPGLDLWFEGRGIWTYSRLYRGFTNDQRHLDIARRSVDLISPTVRTQRPWPRKLDETGLPVGSVETMPYGALFVAEGLAEFAAASGDDEHRQQAADLVIDIIAQHDSVGAPAAVGTTYLGPNAPDVPGAKVLGVYMVALRCLTQMLRQHSDPRLEVAAALVTDRVRTYFDDPQTGLLREVLTTPSGAADNPYRDLRYLGHAIEILWMLGDEAERTGDEELDRWSAAAFLRHLAAARDPVHGGLLRSLLNVWTGEYTTDKTLFPHQEAMIGLLKLLRRGPETDAWAQFIELEDYTRATFMNKFGPSPVWALETDRSGKVVRAQNRIENYHHPRFLMESLTSISELLCSSDR